eukprot:3356449-Rhodomonas_salina.2
MLSDELKKPKQDCDGGGSVTECVDTKDAKDAPGQRHFLPTGVIAQRHRVLTQRMTVEHIPLEVLASAWPPEKVCIGRMVCRWMRDKLLANVQAVELFASTSRTESQHQVAIPAV